MYSSIWGGGLLGRAASQDAAVVVLRCKKRLHWGLLGLESASRRELHVDMGPCTLRFCST